MTSQANDQFLTIAEAADLVKVHRATIQRLIARGDLRSYRVGDRGVRIKRADLEETMRGSNRAPEEAAPLVDPRSLVHSLTPEERRQIRTMVAILKKEHEEQRLRYGGTRPADSGELLNESRDERSRDLAGG